MAMTLVSFLYATGMLATMFGDTLNALDGIIIIDSPSLSVLDFFITMVVIVRIWAFIDFLTELPGGSRPLSEGEENMYG